MEKFSTGVILLWSLAGAEAKAGRHENIEPSHLLVGLCKICDIPINQVLQKGVPGLENAVQEIENEVSEVKSVFQNAGLDVTRFRRALRAELGVGAGASEKAVVHRSPESRRVFKRAAELAGASGNIPHLIHILAMLMELGDAAWAKPLQEMGVNQNDIARTIQEILGAKAPEKADKPAQMRPGGAPRAPQPMAKAPRAPRLPMLEKFGRDLTKLATEGKLDPVIGRGKEMKRLAQVLMQKKKNSVILLGEAGVGKTCVVEGLAQKIVSANAPPSF